MAGPSAVARAIRCSLTGAGSQSRRSMPLCSPPHTAACTRSSRKRVISVDHDYFTPARCSCARRLDASMTDTFAQESMTAGNEQLVAPFGTMPDGRVVEKYTLKNSAGVEISFLNLGGIITRISVPDRTGVFADVTPGYDALEHYLADNRYFGALIGRYANRIADARFVLDGMEHQLSRNDGRNQLHGGAHGFHSVLWKVVPHASAT